MAGIEDFIVEQIIQDFTKQPSSPAPGSSFLADAQYNAQFNRGAPPGAVSDPRAPMGYTIADPALRDRAATANESSARSAALGGILERGMQQRDAQRNVIMKGIGGLDPQIQAVILRRLGIDPGVVKSQVDQQKEVLQFKNQLEAPQHETANAIRMLLASQGAQKNAADFQLKQRAQEQEAASRGQTQNIQLMRTLATLMQSDASGKLTQTLGPILMQMLQGAGINLAPQSKNPASKSGIKITRED